MNGSQAYNYCSYLSLDGAPTVLDGVTSPG